MLEVYDAVVGRFVIFVALEAPTVSPSCLQKRWGKEARRSYALGLGVGSFLDGSEVRRPGEKASASHRTALQQSALAVTAAVGVSGGHREGCSKIQG